MAIDSRQVATAHDAMAEEYDKLDSLWYAWLFAQIHEFIVRNIPTDYSHRPSALDAGCGTGFQSFLLSQAGFDVRGIDISNELLAVARQKIPKYVLKPMESPPLFEARFWSGASAHHQNLARNLEVLRQGRPVSEPTFDFADIATDDLGDSIYDVVVCCGSVLSFIEAYDQAFAKLVKCLRPNGLLIMEVEQKDNFDLLWPIVDNLSGGRLGYDLTWSEVFSYLFARPRSSTQLDYPFELINGDEVILPIWLFSIRDLSRLFRTQAVTVVDRIGVHWITNVIPSTILHKSQNSWLTRFLFRPLSIIDGKLGRLWPSHRLGCSVIFALKKDGSRLMESG